MLVRLEINGILVEESAAVKVSAGQVLIIRGLILDNREPVKGLKVAFKLNENGAEHTISRGETDRLGIVATTYEFPLQKIGETVELECAPEGIQNVKSIAKLIITQ